MKPQEPAGNVPDVQTVLANRRSGKAMQGSFDFATLDAALVDYKAQKPPSQRERILAAMLAGEELTVITALERIGTTELRNYVYILRMAGIPIQDRWATGANGKRHKVYFLSNTLNNQSHE
jgi:hypothetical protein